MAWTSLLPAADRVAERGPALPTNTLPGKLPGWLGWSAYTLGCFVICVVWTFPTEVILDRAVVSLAHKTDVHVDYRYGNLAWPGQAVLHEVAVTSPSWLALPSLQLSRLAVRPSLVGLLHNSPVPLRLEVNGYGGEGWATIDQAADGMVLEFVLRQLELARLPLPAGESPLSGQLTAEGTVEGELQDLLSLSGPVSIQLTDGAAPEIALQGMRLPSLKTLAAELRAELSQGQVVVQTARLRTDGVEAHLQGSIRLRTPLSRSRLELELQVKKTGTPPPVLASLISLLPGSAAGGRTSITGVLGAPHIRSVR